MKINFLYHLEHQMVQIPSWLHSTFNDLSNEYSHAQIRVKMKKLWPRQVGEEKQNKEVMASTSWRRNTGCCQESMSRPVSRPGSMSRPVSNQAVCRDQCRDQASCRDQKALSRPETLRNLKKRPKINILT